MDTEVIAVEAVKKCLAYTDFLKAYGGEKHWLNGDQINDGEKMPSWDGDIIIYNKTNFDKHNIKKLPIQVKGLKKEDLSKEKIKYPISKIDLNNYYNDGGVIYFVVYVDDSRNEKIYYRELLPVYIRDLLKQPNSNNGISIEFKAFPMEDNNEKVNICYEFWMNRQRQFSYINAVLPQVFIRETGQEKIAPIKVNDIIFYDRYTIIKDTESTIIRIGTLLQMKVLNSNSTENKVSINIKGTLKQRIKGMHFLLSAISNQSFYIGDVLIDLTPKADSPDILKELEIKEKLSWLEKFQEVLNILGVKADLEMDNLTDKDINKMNALIECIYHKNFLHNKPINLPFQGVMKIANLSLTLICVLNAENEYEYKFFNAFDTNLWAYNFDNKNPDKKFPVCCTLKRDNFLYDNNINYEFILNRIKEYEPNDLLLDMANQLVLQMLLAYDLNKNDDLFKALETLAQYIYNNDDFDKDVAEINLLQIKQRKRKLNSSELKKLNEIYIRTDQTIIKIGCLILLKSYDLAETLLGELSEEEQKSITNYPIYNLLKNR